MMSRTPKLAVVATIASLSAFGFGCSGTGKDRDLGSNRSVEHNSERMTALQISQSLILARENEANKHTREVLPVFLVSVSEQMRFGGGMRPERIEQILGVPLDSTGRMPRLSEDDAIKAFENCRSWARTVAPELNQIFTKLDHRLGFSK